MNKQNGVSTRSTAVTGEIPEIRKKNTIVRFIGEVDRPFMIMVIILLAIGSVMVLSASYAYAQTNFGDSFYFAKRQVIWIVIGLCIMAAVAKFIRPSLIKKFAWIGYAIAVVLNILVLFVGKNVNGARRQIEIGPISFQPSEILKFFTIIICAKYISENLGRIKSFKYGILPFAIFAAPPLLLFVLQSHLSATLITLILIFFMMLIGGSNSAWLGGIGGAGALGALYVSNNIDSILNLTIVQEKLSHVYRRLLVWKDPFTYMKNDEWGDPGWQPAQSIYAISSGGFWGLGLGKSMEKHGYLPEPQNDYIFAILCEELGFAGAAVIICLFALLIIRGFHIARNCNDKFSSLLVMGLVIQLGLQVILNIAVVTNTIPSTGISLPFFSYGGTALCIVLAEMGIILSVSRYSYLDKE